MFRIKVGRENKKKHILRPKTFSENRGVAYIMWEKYGWTRQATDDNKIRRLRIACKITKATDTHSEYVIFIDFPRQQWSMPAREGGKYQYKLAGDGGTEGGPGTGYVAYVFVFVGSTTICPMKKLTPPHTKLNWQSSFSDFWWRFLASPHLLRERGSKNFFARGERGWGGLTLMLYVIWILCFPSRSVSKVI